MKKEIIQNKLKNIKAFVFDVDGVFTDSCIIMGENEPMRKYNLKDGYGVSLLSKLEFPMAIISGGKETSIIKRFEPLGIKDIYINTPTDKKLEVFDNYLKKIKLPPEEILYIGDDIADLLVMKNRPVFACCPKDAVKEVKKQAVYVTKKKGGEGAVREVIELVLKAQNKWLIKF